MSKSLEEQRDTLVKKLGVIQARVDAQVGKIEEDVSATRAQNESMRHELESLKMQCKLMTQRTSELARVNHDEEMQKLSRKLAKLEKMKKDKSGHSLSKSPVSKGLGRPRKSSLRLLSRSTKNARSNDRESLSSIDGDTSNSTMRTGRWSPGSSMRQRMGRAESMPVISMDPQQMGLTQSAPGGGKSKLEMMFGEAVQELPEEEGLSFVREKASAQVVIKGGELEHLIRKLYEGGPGGDKAYIASFLISYRSIATSEELLHLMTEHYSRYGSDSSDASRMRLKIISFFRQWFDKYFHEWDDDAFIDEYLAWLESTLSIKHQSVAKQLAALAEKKRSGARAKIGERIFDENPPKPIRPPAGFTRATDVDAKEMARQLSIIQSEMFQAIRPEEYWNKGWEAKDKHVRAPNLSKFVQHFNFLGAWCATTIMSETVTKNRTSVVEYWMRVAEYMHQLNNFAGVMSLLGGLGSAAVARLKKAWKNVGRKPKAAMEKMQALMSPMKSFNAYRTTVHTTQPPLVPYLGIYMQDMVFIEDGNPDKLSNGQINFQKRRLYADVMKEMQQYQQTPYNLEVLPEVVAYMDKVEVLNETQLYEKSLILEPRKPAT